jgi:rubrerythrin
MDAATFVAEIEDAKVVELDRLGSQQSLVALTDANLDAETVLRAAARSEAVARETFAEWADSESNTDASEAFAALADREADHFERVAAELDEDAATELDDESDAAEAVDPMHARLRELDATIERAAGLVGRSLAADQAQLQVVNFFVNEADERRADLFRELRAETQDSVSTGSELLERECDGEEDWERARETAEAVVQIAYDDYAETLQGMGLDPKPIC